jgi:hypothetical protein
MEDTWQMYWYNLIHICVNPETETNPDQKPTFEQKTDPDPDRCQKVNPAELYFPLLEILDLRFCLFIPNSFIAESAPPNMMVD